MLGQPQRKHKIYSPATLDEFRAARNDQLNDPDNVDIVFTGELMDAVVMAITELQVRVDGLSGDPIERRAV